MKQFKGTKGEWRVAKFTGGLSVMSGTDIVANPIGGKKLANAQLIAAAPELLEALQRIKKSIEAQDLKDRFGHTIMYVDQAINKALGE